MLRRQVDMAMNLAAIIEGPLLEFGFIFLGVGVITRMLFFVFSIIKGSKDKENRGTYFFKIFGQFLVPFHKAVLKKPVYSLLRYVFHICLFVVPLWLAGHISLWKNSRLEWSWSPLPDVWADWMTILLLVLAVFFIIRHFALKEIRLNSSLADYLIIIITALPFATGYCLTHGTLAQIPFFGSNIWTIHILSGEIMILAAVPLFCCIRMNTETCTGCAACALACPTETLESKDVKNLRLFNYSHSQCICCASCVNACPDKAAELHHEISLKRLYNFFTTREIRSVELESCKRCGTLIVPEPLMKKIHKLYTDEYLEFCPACRKRNLGEYLKKISPYH
jgi:NAD-dependent dihydropyrimidine dehydrogenase PreA subunit